jgi:hypothetical protein
MCKTGRAGRLVSAAAFPGNRERQVRWKSVTPVMATRDVGVVTSARYQPRGVPGSGVRRDDEIAGMQAADGEMLEDDTPIGVQR